MPANNHPRVNPHINTPTAIKILEFLLAEALPLAEILADDTLLSNDAVDCYNRLKETITALDAIHAESPLD